MNEDEQGHDEECVLGVNKDGALRRRTCVRAAAADLGRAKSAACSDSSFAAARARISSLSTSSAGSPLILRHSSYVSAPSLASSKASMPLCGTRPSPLPESVPTRTRP